MATEFGFGIGIDPKKDNKPFFDFHLAQTGDELQISLHHEMALDAVQALIETLTRALKVVKETKGGHEEELISKLNSVFQSVN